MLRCCLPSGKTGRQQKASSKARAARREDAALLSTPKDAARVQGAELGPMRPKLTTFRCPFSAARCRHVRTEPSTTFACEGSCLRISVTCVRTCGSVNADTQERCMCRGMHTGERGWARVWMHDASACARTPGTRAQTPSRYLSHTLSVHDTSRAWHPLCHSSPRCPTRARSSSSTRRSPCWTGLRSTQGAGAGSRPSSSP